MLHHRFALLAAALAVASQAPLGAQSDSTRLTVERIFTGGEFAPQSFAGTRWLADGRAYTRLERADSGPGRSLVRYDAATGAKTVLVPAARLTDARQMGEGKHIRFTVESGGARARAVTRSRHSGAASTRAWKVDIAGAATAAGNLRPATPATGRREVDLADREGQPAVAVGVRQRARADRRLPRELDEVACHLKNAHLLPHLQDVQRIFFAEFSNLRRIGFRCSSDGSAPASASCCRRGCGSTARAAAAERHAEGTARAVAHRTNQNISAFFCRIDGSSAHERPVVATEPVQCEDQRSLLLLHDLPDRSRDSPLRQDMVRMDVSPDRPVGLHVVY